MTDALPDIAWIPSPNFSSRGGRKVRLVVVHDCEGSYEGAVSWFKQARSRVSAHLVLSEDGTHAAQMVAYANKAWHACEFNAVSEGIELGGYSAKGFASPEWRSAAALVACRLEANGLPATWARGGEGAGFTSHYDLGSAGGGHLDPTTDLTKWEQFVEMVVAAHEAFRCADGVAVKAVADGLATSPQNALASRHSRYDFAVGTVEWVQAELNARAISQAPLTVDGIISAGTQAAIVAYQRVQGLAADGIAGPLTVKSLLKAAA